MRDKLVKIKIEKGERMFEIENKFMNESLIEAKKAFFNDEVPVGCVIVVKNTQKIIARGYNLKENSKNVIKHAEIIAIEKACKQKNSWRLNDCEIYITLEPCLMCLGAIIESRISKIIYGTPRSQSNKINISEVYNGDIKSRVLDEKCSKILSDFFEKRRK